MDGLKHCPKCAVGLLYPTAADEHGTNVRCFACGWGGTIPNEGEATEPSVRGAEDTHSKSGGLRSPVPLGADQLEDAV